MCLLHLGLPWTMAVMLQTDRVQGLAPLCNDWPSGLWGWSNRRLCPWLSLGVWGEAQIVITVGVRTQRASVTQSGKSLLKSCLI